MEYQHLLGYYEVLHQTDAWLNLEEIDTYTYEEGEVLWIFVYTKSFPSVRRVSRGHVAFDLEEAWTKFCNMYELVIPHDM